MIQAAPKSIPAASLATAATHELAAAAQRRFRECPYQVLRRVNCRFHEGVLILTGTVPTFYMKQVAQTLACNSDQVEHLDNRLSVSY